MDSQPVHVASRRKQVALRLDCEDYLELQREAARRRLSMSELAGERYLRGRAAERPAILGDG